MTWVIRRAVVEVRYAAECVGYWVRSYDDILDARRWRWQARGRCQFSMTPDEFEEFTRRWLAEIERRAITGDGDGQPRGFLRT